MKKTRLISLMLIYILYLIPTSLSAQIGEDSTKTQNYFITINLLSQANPLNPRWKVGFIKGIRPRLKFGIDIAYGNSNLSFWKAETGSSPDQVFTENYRLWEFSPQLYYFVNSNNVLPTYISATFSYINHKDTYYSERYYLSRKGIFGVYYKQADYTRKKYALVFNYGVLVGISKNIGLNIYTGLGFRLKNNQFSKVIEGKEGDYRRTDTMNIIAYRDNEGLYLGANFSFGVKLHFKSE